MMILSESETRPTSQEKLVVEVQGTFAALVMVKAKCIDTKESYSAPMEGRSR